MKKIKGWKTIIVNIIVATIPILELTEWSHILSPGIMPYYIISVALLNVFLRSVTNSPIGRSQ